MKNKGVLFLAQAAMIAAVYVVLTFVFAPISFGGVQVRISEALTILPILLRRQYRVFLSAVCSETFWAGLCSGMCSAAVSPR